MIDNFELIKSLFYFNEANDMFFHLQIVQRAKDHKGENKKVKESAIKTYFIRSREHLDRVKEEKKGSNVSIEALKKKKYNESIKDLFKNLWTLQDTGE